MCNEGWGGLFCNQDLNYCTNHKPCKNGGTCFNTGQGSYTCSCAPGFTGTDCETPLLDCHSKPCLNGGSCSMDKKSNSSVSSSSAGSTASNGNNNGNNNNNSNSSSTDLSARNYRCTCPPGWRGRHCEVSSRSCRDSPCLHGGSCDEDSLRGYTCHCPSGYTGTDCETQVDECSPNPCNNGGTCSDMVNGFRCQCPLGFTGERCEINVDDCQGDPCMNGGTCVDLVNRFRCQCVPGFVGRLCQDKVDYCLAKPCANGGKCISGTNDYQCACKPGFTGKDCSVDVDECRSGPCRNGGTCRNRVNGFTCECTEGWRGETCNDEGAIGVAVRTSGSGPASSPPSGASSAWSGNLARPSAEARDAGLTTEHVVVIATLSTAVPAFVLVAAVAVMCMKRRQKREQARADEEARLQNERNAVHSSMSKRGAGGGGGGQNGVGCNSGSGNAGNGGGILGGGTNGNGLIGIAGNGVSNGVGSNGNGGCSLGSGDSHMIKNTWTANKNVNNANSANRDDLDSSFVTDSGLDISCNGYKPEPVMQDSRTTRTAKQLNTEAAAHRASHHFHKEKDLIGGGVSVGVLEGKRTSVYAVNNGLTESCCGAAEASLMKRPSTIADTGATDAGCGVYVIDDHYRHDAALAATLATEV